MAAPLLPAQYRYNVVYADDVHQGVMFRSYHDEMYTDVIRRFPNDPVGHRRLVHRDFTNIRGILTCVEHTVARVAANGLPSDWSLDVTVFRTHTVPPVRWNENNIDAVDLIDPADITDPFAQSSSLLLFAAQEADRAHIENLARMNHTQDALSRIPDAH